MFGPAARDGEMDVTLFHSQHGMFSFVGYSVLAPVVSCSPVRKTPEEREERRRQVCGAFSNLGARPVLPWNMRHATPPTRWREAQSCVSGSGFTPEPLPVRDPC
ncbi:hypothetical protein [Deinococcus taeanensis]|uniref:hypothetical protein n=1 Tax=Deinococcus taeanensis TaxID=2737050 RepID=UPI0032E7FA7A